MSEIKYITFYGHKKAIAELLSVSTNRIGEWQRIYAACKEYRCQSKIHSVMKNRENSLVMLLSALKSIGWHQTKKYISLNLNCGSESSTTFIEQRRKRLRDEFIEGEKSIADPDGRLDFIASIKNPLSDDCLDNLCAVMDNNNEGSEPTLIYSFDSNTLYKSFDELSPFDYQFAV